MALVKVLQADPTPEHLMLFYLTLSRKTRRIVHLTCFSVYTVWLLIELPRRTAAGYLESTAPINHT
jgi:hypothetical protein